MRAWLTISFLLVSLGGFTQQAPIDSLTSRLEENLHDTDRVNTLNALAWKLKYANPDTAIILSSEALSYAKAYKWQPGIANSTGYLGTFSYLKGDYPKALEYLFIALSIDKELYRKSGIVIRVGMIGIIYDEQGDYPRALEYYFKALSMNEEMDSKMGIAINLGNIGIVYRNQGDDSKALEYFFKALSMNKELGRKTGYTINLGNIGNVYDQQEDYSKALEYYFKALEMDEELGNNNGITRHLGNIGGVYRAQGDYPKAQEYMFKSLKMAEEVGDKNSVARLLGNLGALYTDISEFKKAEITLLKALRLSKEIGIKEYLKYQYEYLSNLYDTTGRPALAFESYKLYILYRDSIDNEENTKAQTRTEMKYEYETAELVKQQEEKEQARLKAEVTSRRDNLQYSIILIGILILASFILLLGKIRVNEKLAEGIIFFSFLILFEFILVLADPYIENWSGGAPGFKLLFNAGIAALIFPLHAYFESKLKGRLVKS